MNFDLVGKAMAARTQDLGSFPNLSEFIVPSSGNSPQKVIGNAIQFLLLIAGALAVVYLIYGGVLYITAGGDAEKATKGRTAIINSIIGIVIIALAYVIVTWVGNAILTGSSN